MLCYHVIDYVKLLDCILLCHDMLHVGRDECGLLGGEGRAGSGEARLRREYVFIWGIGVYIGYVYQTLVARLLIVK